MVTVEVVQVSVTRFPIVPVSEALSNQCELEIDGLVISFRHDEPSGPKPLTIDARGATVFEVRGLRPGYKAWIVQEKDACQLMHEPRSAEAEWLGEYSSIENALRALSNKIAV